MGISESINMMKENPVISSVRIAASLSLSLSLSCDLSIFFRFDLLPPHPKCKSERSHRGTHCQVESLTNCWAVSAQNLRKVLLADDTSEWCCSCRNYCLRIHGGGKLGEAFFEPMIKNKVSKIKEERSSKCLCKDGEGGPECDPFRRKCVLYCNQRLTNWVSTLDFRPFEPNFWFKEKA